MRALKPAWQRCGERASELPCRIDDSCAAPDKWLLNLFLERRNDGNSVVRCFIVVPIIKLFSNVRPKFLPRCNLNLRLLILSTMDAEDHLFLADPFHVLEHLRPLSANNPACPYGLPSFLKEKVYLVRYTSLLTATVLFTPGDTPACCRFGFLFIYRAAERRTLPHEIQMKAGHA